MPRIAFAGVLNPKKSTLLQCTTDTTYDDPTVEITPVDSDEDSPDPLGSGWFNNEPEYIQSEDLSGYPRVHITQEGVRERGHGYGTAIYTALCVAAHMVFKKQLALNSRVVGDGISSMSEGGGRSPDADVWWHNAVRTYKLAQRIRYETVEESEFGGTLPIDNLEYLNEIIEDLTGHQFSKIKSASLTLSGTQEEPVAVEVEIYPFEKAVEANLVPFTLPKSKVAWFYEYDDRQADVYSLDALEAIDLSGIHKLIEDGEERGILSAEWLLNLAKRAGMRPGGLECMERRLQYGYDPNDETRMNPPSRVAQKDLRRVSEIRNALGWDRFRRERT